MYALSAKKKVVDINGNNLWSVYKCVSRNRLPNPTNMFRNPSFFRPLSFTSFFWRSRILIVIYELRIPSCRLPRFREITTENSPDRVGHVRKNHAEGKRSVASSYPACEERRASRRGHIFQIITDPFSIIHEYVDGAERDDERRRRWHSREKSLSIFSRLFWGRVSAGCR